MSTTIIRREVRKNGALYDATSVKFRNQAATIGVRRMDTLANVVAPGTDLPRISQGIYEYSFVDPAPGLAYNYWVEFEVDGQTFWKEYDLAAVAASVTSRYFTYQQLADAWGGRNLTLYSNKDSNNTTPNYQAIQDAADWADQEIDNCMRGGVVDVPTAVNWTTRQWALIFTFYKVFMGRGIAEANTNPMAGRVKKLAQEVYDDIQQFRGGMKQFSEAINQDFDAEPSSIFAADDEDFVLVNPEYTTYVHLRPDSKP